MDRASKGTLRAISQAGIEFRVRDRPRSAGFVVSMTGEKSKPKLAAVAASRALIQHFYESHDDDPAAGALATAMRILEYEGDVYAIQTLAVGARALIQHFYESHDDDPLAGALRAAMRILDAADERLESLGARVEGIESRVVAHR